MKNGLYSLYLRINENDAPLWYATKSFYDIKKCNEFLEANPEYGLLCEKESFNGKPVYILAKKTDKGKEKLRLVFESEDTGYCRKYYRSESCTRLFAMLSQADGGLHTCNDDAWREPGQPVKENIFILGE